MLDRSKLINILLFMERASKTLEGATEIRAFAQTYEAVAKTVEQIDKRAAKKGEKK